MQNVGEKQARMGMKLRISLELLVVLAQEQFPLLSYKRKESSAADNTDQAGSLLERNATSSHEKLRWSHFLKQKGYYQHSYLGCIIRGSRLFVRFIFFFFSWMESMAEFKVSFNYYPSSATEHRRKLSFLKKTIFLRRKNNNMGIFSSGKNAQVSKEG